METPRAEMREQDAGRQAVAEAVRGDAGAPVRDEERGPCVPVRDVRGVPGELREDGLAGHGDRGPGAAGGGVTSDLLARAQSAVAAAEASLDELMASAPETQSGMSTNLLRRCVKALKDMTTAIFDDGVRHGRELAAAALAKSPLDKPAHSEPEPTWLCAVCGTIFEWVCRSVCPDCGSDEVSHTAPLARQAAPATTACPAVESGTGHRCHLSYHAIAGRHFCSHADCGAWYTHPYPGCPPEATHGLDGRALGDAAIIGCDGTGVATGTGALIPKPPAPPRCDKPGNDYATEMRCTREAMDAIGKGSIGMSWESALNNLRLLRDARSSCSKPGHSGLTCAGCAAEGCHVIGCPMAGPEHLRVSRVPAPLDPAASRALVELIDAELARLDRQAAGDATWAAWREHRIALLGNARARLQGTTETPAP